MATRQEQGSEQGLASALEAQSLSERDRALDAVRDALKDFADYALKRDAATLKKAQEALASSDPERCAAFLREHLVNATDRNMLHAESPTQQKGIYARYKEARYQLSVLNHLDWYPNYRAWSGDGAVFDEEKFREIEAHGGFRGISADPSKQIYWQDVLDHVLQSRFYGVRGALLGAARNASGEHSQKGVRGAPLTFLAGDHELAWMTEFDHVGAGRNVAGLHYVVRHHDDATGQMAELLRIDDHMAMDSDDMAEFIRRQSLETLQARLTRNASLQDLSAVVSEAIPDDDHYTVGFRDAVESVLLALHGKVPQDLLREAVDTALDAYQNNAPEPDGVGLTPGH